MTFKKRHNRDTRYARNKEKKEVKEIVNDSMYVIYDKPVGKTRSSIPLIFPDAKLISKSVLPVIEDKRVSLLQRIKNFINNIFK